jgi:putative hydrolase of the HAD superfamily
MVGRRIAIFDLDDTLVDTSDVYWRSRAEFLDLMERAGFDRDLALEEFESIDGQNIVKHGYAPERYEVSMLATYAELCRVAGKKSDQAIVEDVQCAGRIVQTASPALIAGAIELLDGVRNEGMRIALVTRGVDKVQRQKVAVHKLRGHFDKIEVVAREKAGLFSRLIAEAGASPSDCWVIGDSVKSDINPGIEAGANCILYLYSHHSYHWRQKYGVQPRGSFYIARSLYEVLEILRAPHLKVRTSTVPERDPKLPV